jgi:hypothetical protein
MTPFARRAIVAAVLTPLTLGLLACDTEERDRAAAGPGTTGTVKPRQIALSRGVSAGRPPGWRVLREPTNQVIYNVSFRDHGRRFQVFVMLDRERVDPRVRRQTITLLSSMRFANPHADRPVRREVMDGVRRDFQAAADDPSGFGDCFLARFGRELTREELRRLIALRAARGEPAAARALNDLGVQPGDVCGGRRWVPQLTEAASGLGAG